MTAAGTRLVARWAALNLLAWVRDWLADRLAGWWLVDGRLLGGDAETTQNTVGRYARWPVSTA
jgi:hypothetical protein